MSDPSSSDNSARLDAAIRRIDKLVATPSEGLPESLFRFVSSVTPMVNVDLLISNPQGQILLTWRDDGHYSPGWHVPGGIVRYKETVKERVSAVADLELGAEVECSHLLAIHEVTDTLKSVRGHFISFLYACALVTPPAPDLRCNNSSPQHQQWLWHESCPENLLEVQGMYRPFISGAVEETGSCHIASRYLRARIL